MKLRKSMKGEVTQMINMLNGDRWREVAGGRRKNIFSSVSRAAWATMAHMWLCSHFVPRDFQRYGTLSKMIAKRYVTDFVSQGILRRYGTLSKMTLVYSLFLSSWGSSYSFVHSAFYPPKIHCRLSILGLKKVSLTVEIYSCLTQIESYTMRRLSPGTGLV